MAKPMSSRDLIRACGQDPDEPLGHIDFPSEMRMRPATDEEAQRGLNDVWPSDMVPLYSKEITVAQDEQVTETVAFAWTATEGYKHYPPYINLTGNRLIVRGPETFDGEHYREGERVEIELPSEAIAAMQAVAQETKSTQVADAVERLAEHLSACTHADHAVLTTRLRYALERCGLTLAAMPAVDEREKLREALEQIERAVGEARSQPGSNHTELLRQIYAVVRAALSNEPKP